MSQFVSTSSCVNRECMGYEAGMASAIRFISCDTFCFVIVIFQHVVLVCFNETFYHWECKCDKYCIY